MFNNAMIASKSLSFLSVVYEFTQGQGPDVGTFVEYGSASGNSNGDGLITLVSATTSPMVFNRLGYSIPDPTSSTSGGTIRVSGSITSSGPTRPGDFIDFVVAKSGEPNQTVFINASGDFNFNFVFNNSNDAAFEILLRDIGGLNDGATIQVNSLTFTKLA